MLRHGIILAFLFFAGAARAHDAFASTASAQVATTGVRLDLTLARSMAIELLAGQPGLPRVISDENFDRFAEPLRSQGASLFSITAGKNPLSAGATEVELNEENDVIFHVAYSRPTGNPLLFRARYLAKMPGGHTATLTVETAEGKDLGWSYLDSLTPDLEVVLPAALLGADAASTPASSAATEKNPVPHAPPFSAFLKLGIGHILKGYDHLLFLAGLIIACRRFATMAGIITCFTLAHSLTLALAALNVVTLPGRIVEPLIAASIVFVGVENLVQRGGEPRGRWLLAFGFGLVHGFGFASALKAAGLGAGGASLLMPLFSFNLGVELGQIAVAAALLPILFQLRRRPNFVRYGVPAASAVVALLGAYWLVQRTMLS